ncbi:DNA topoisomerase-1 [Dyella jiangningensis]|uniref:DNA topoisomerase IB n=1 Tax=Dyella sp. AtDHG13 TaxID=1938897 RepID=UPI00087EAA6E|nr:DNA topoisomerase IB [Dyella sp. AtDHG13]PXV55861.1 DNA topoisomerase-1 [Dyella sp. AtDHG13]SDK53434.1 DNA topoisomerase-1 [Dyella jiangningensis]
MKRTTVSPRREAKAAGLRYVTDDAPGWHRRRSGKGFTYWTERGRRITDPRTLARIRSLAIPPAYRDVWICPDARGHLQATGRDAKGRKQYRYHPRWRSTRDEGKFSRMATFGRCLPAMRRRVTADLRRPGIVLPKVLAAIVRLLDTTLLRIGNTAYAQSNGSYGVTTLRQRHARTARDRLMLRFRGKSGIEREVDVREPAVARLVKRLQELPGQRLFKFLDEDGNTHPVDSGMVNAYLKEISGHDFTAKDFRTWGATVLAVVALGGTELAADASKAAQRSLMKSAIQSVAAQLGHTPAVCRQSYVHPAVLRACEDGSLQSAYARLSRHDRSAMEKLTLRLL